MIFIVNQVINLELKALNDLKEDIDESIINECVNLITNTEGNILITGVGTSSSIAKRTAHLFDCAGLPAFYVHPSDQQHGASGLLSGKDAIIAFSKGGESEEVNNYLEIAKKLGSKIIALTGRESSTMSELVDISVVFKISDEFELLKVLPTSSTLAAALVSDVLLTSIVNKKGFDKKKFSLLHPGGWTYQKLTEED